ncbi:MAG: molybdopterin-dependent oxidoreductase, partial [Alphaproteobacteria bacterium]|nr:molybdopterin-dependent oxidoreductase [Alphaproteobacteria bacterium]
MGPSATRRGFLKCAAALSGTALVVGFDRAGARASPGAPDFNPFVRIDPDGVVTVILKHFETGQGTMTGLATLVAEELDADWDHIETAFAPADGERYKNLATGFQGTGGSTAIANAYVQYRRAGAAARAALVAAAAGAWGVAPSAV